MKKILTSLIVIATIVSVAPFMAFARTDEIHISTGQLVVGMSSEITIVVRETGTRALVQGAEVVMDGCGINTRRTTNAKGEAVFNVVPTETGKVKITATIQGMRPTGTEIPVVPDKSPPPLDLDPLVPVTNQPSLTVVGRTRSGTEVYVGRVKAVVDEKGNFKATVQLSEGDNHIVVKSSTQYASTTKEFLVTLDTRAPSVIIENDFGKEDYVDVKTITVKGRVDPGSKVTINGVEATVVNDFFICQIPVSPGKNTLTIVATDQVGNKTTIEKEILVYTMKNIKITIGSTIGYVDGKETTLDAPPVLDGGRTMVPLRFIGEVFGAEVSFDSTTKQIFIHYEQKSIVLTIGSNQATIDGKVVTLDVPAQIVGGRTMVPVRFIADAFEANTSYDSATKTVTITKKILP